MSLRAGFAEIDITPPVGVQKIGWLIRIIADTIHDPLYARAAIFEAAGERMAIIQADTLSLRWTTVQDLRQRISTAYGFPGDHILVAATHNHAGPAVSSLGETHCEEAYVEEMVSRMVAMFGQALAGMRPAQLGIGTGFNFTLAHNRRVVMRNGTVITHGTFATPDALCLEGPIDPEVAVIAARDDNGRLLGALVNYACHPTHFGGATIISAGWPGAFADAMKAAGCPVPLFLNGAFGNMHTADPVRGGAEMTLEEAGHALAADALRIIAGMTFRDTVRLQARNTTLRLPYRELTPEQLTGTAHGAQRFIDAKIYDGIIADLQEKIRREGAQPVEVQVLSIDEYALAGIPAELFAEHGLQIKKTAYPCHALVVGAANGMVGYVPHRAAFLHGGYETTFAGWSQLAPAAGELLCEAVLALIRETSAVH